MIDLIAYSKFFCKIDLKSRHQVCMRVGDESKTTFKAKDGLDKWLFMPFVLFNTPCSLMYFMHKVFQAFNRRFLVLYMIEVFIGLKSDNGYRNL